MFILFLISDARLLGVTFTQLTFGVSSPNKMSRSESYGLAVEHSAHNWKVVGLIPMLDGCGVKAMPGSIPTPDPGSFKK